MNREPVCRPPGGEAVRPPERDADQRRCDWVEAVECYSEEQARLAASRCLATIECTWCEVCELLCPDLCITRDPDTGHVRIDLDHCKGCGLCAHFCPKGAIQMEVEHTGEVTPKGDFHIAADVG